MRVDLLVCPLCRIALSPTETVCPRDGHEGVPSDLGGVPGALEDRFHLLEPFGQGGTGDLLLVDDQQTGRRGILKVLRLPEEVTPGIRARLKRDLLKQAALSHDVLSVPLSTGDANGVPWLFREWHEGVSLAVRLFRSGSFPVPEAVAIAAQVAGALNELHRAGLLHRGVKPGHVVLQLQPGGLPRARLIDAGIAWPDGTGGDGAPASRPYPSPEEARGKQASFRTDLYALGCLLYELLAGEAPFLGTPEEVEEAHRTKSPPALEASVPGGLSSLLAQLLAKEPRDRPFSAAQVRRNLEAYLPSDGASRRDSTQTFERLTGKRSPAPPGGTLPPPGGGGVDALLAAEPPATRAVSATTPPPAPKLGFVPALSRRSTMELSSDDLQAVADEEPADATEETRATGARPAAESRSGVADATSGVVAKEELEAGGDDDTPPEGADEPSAGAVDAHAGGNGMIRAKRRAHIAATGTLVGWPASDDEETERLSLDELEAVPASEVKPRSSVPPPPPTASAAADEPEADASPSAEGDTPLDGTEEFLPMPGPAPVPEESSMIPPPDMADASAEEADTVGPRGPQTTPPPLPSAPPPRSAPPPSLSARPPAPASVPPVRTTAGTTTTSFAPRPPPPAGLPPLGTVVPGVLSSSPPTSLPPGAWPATGTLPPGTSLTAPPMLSTNPPGSVPVRPITALGCIFATAAGGALLGGVLVYLFLLAFPAPAPRTARVGEAPVGPGPEARPPGMAPEVTRLPADEELDELDDEELDDALARDEGYRADEGYRSARDDEDDEATGVDETAAPVDPAAARREAARARREARERNQRRFEALRSRGRESFREGRFDDAAAAYEAATRLNPRHAGSFAGLGAARLRQGNPAAAARAYRRAVSLSPRTSAFHAALGNALLAGGDAGGARAAYRRALDLDPDNRTARAGLASLGG
ncbi:MAG: tetratricopeptide repeat protein [Sandaracinaceae bacterium]